MPSQLEARIVVTRGRRADLMAEIAVWEPACDKLTKMGTAGPTEAMIEHRIREMKKQFERRGHRVSVLERR